MIARFSGILDKILRVHRLQAVQTVTTNITAGELFDRTYYIWDGYSGIYGRWHGVNSNLLSP